MSDWKTSPAWKAHRGIAISESRHHRTCCFDAGLQAANARIEKLEAALHTATELLRGISEENLAMSTPSLVAADAFLAALDEEGGG